MNVRDLEEAPSKHLKKKGTQKMKNILRTNVMKRKSKITQIWRSSKLWAIHNQNLFLDRFACLDAEWHPELSCPSTIENY